MAEDGTSFAINIPVTGAEGIQLAADKLDQLTERLTSSSKTAVDAANAMRAGEQAYKQSENIYDRASKALEKLNASMEGASGKKLANLIERQAEAAKWVDTAKAAMDRESVALDKLRTSAAGADKELDHLTQAQAAAKKGLDASKKSQADSFAANELLAGSLGKLGGPLGAAGQKAFELKGAWDKMGKALGAAGPYAAIAVAFVAVAASIAIVAAAAIAGVAQIAAWAVGLADATRTSVLLASGMVQSAAGGEELHGAIDKLARRVPQTSEELTKMAGELAKTGLRGKALTDTLETNAEAAAKLKFGPEWQKQMVSLDVQQRKLKSGINSLFSGLKIDALLEGLSTLTDLFDESSASGQAIKVVFESIFQPIVDGASGLVPVVRHTFLQFEILALKALISLKPWGSTIMKVGEVIGIVGAIMVSVFAFAIGVVIAAIASLAVSIALPIALFAALVAGTMYLTGVFVNFGTQAVAGISAAWDAVVAFGAGILASLSSISLVDSGMRLIDGLVQGITQGATAVVAAVEGAATSAIGAAKKALGIASPSKVFAEIGAYTGEGMQLGIEASSGGVEAAMTDLATPVTGAAPGAAATPSAASAPAGAAGGNVFNITIHGSEDLVERVKQAVTDVMENAAIQLGAAVPA